MRKPAARVPMALQRRDITAKPTAKKRRDQTGRALHLQGIIATGNRLLVRSAGGGSFNTALIWDGYGSALRVEQILLAGAEAQLDEGP